MTQPLIERLERELEERRHAGLLRAIPPAQEAARRFIDLSTNSYLALHENTAVAAEALRLAGGRLSGNTASRLIAENSPLAAELEAELAAWKNTEAALIFNSGYAANIGILQAICSRDTELFCDRLNHASIIDGVLLSGCRLQRYRHCDMIDLEHRIAASKAREKLIVTDTVFSMDGDCAPLPDICSIAEKHGCSVMVDEAHATGIFGASGSGLSEALGVAAAIDFRVGTLSKAVAGLGGFFCGSRLLREHLVNHARSLIYSTGMPHAAIAFDLASVRHIRAHPGAGRAVLKKAGLLRDRLRENGFNTLSSTTQIVPCAVRTAGSALALSAHLRRAGIIAPAVRPPTVPDGGSRVRFSLHAGVSDDELETVAAAVQDWKPDND